MNTTKKAPRLCIASIRAQKGISVSQLAKELNVKEKLINKWENGIAFPSIPEIITLAKVLDVSAVELFTQSPLTGNRNDESITTVLLCLYGNAKKREKQTAWYGGLSCIITMLLFGLLLIEQTSGLLFCGTYLPMLSACLLAFNIIFVIVTHRSEKYIKAICIILAFILLAIFALCIIAPIIGAPIPE